MALQKYNEIASTKNLQNIKLLENNISISLKKLYTSGI